MARCRPKALPISGSQMSLVDHAPDGFEDAKGAESFDSACLYSKVGSRAGLYLAAGFEALVCQRFQARRAPDEAFEACVYTMSDAAAASSVFWNQRPEAAVGSRVAPGAYRSDRAVAFTVGRRYVEVVSGRANRAMLDALESYARRLMGASMAWEEAS